MRFDDPHSCNAERIAPLVEAILARHGVKAQLGCDDALVDLGMTSVAMVELMLAVESGFKLSIPDAELTPVNFFSISSVARLVKRLINEAFDKEASRFTQTGTATFV